MQAPLFAAPDGNRLVEQRHPDRLIGQIRAERDGMPAAAKRLHVGNRCGSFHSRSLFTPRRFGSLCPRSDRKADEDPQHEGRRRVLQDAFEESQQDHTPTGNTPPGHRAHWRSHPDAPHRCQQDDYRGQPEEPGLGDQQTPVAVEDVPKFDRFHAGWNLIEGIRTVGDHFADRPRCQPRSPAPVSAARRGQPPGRAN